jgi:hypothetical protein
MVDFALGTSLRATGWWPAAVVGSVVLGFALPWVFLSVVNLAQRCTPLPCRGECQPPSPFPCSAPKPHYKHSAPSGSATSATASCTSWVLASPSPARRGLSGSPRQGHLLTMTGTRVRRLHNRAAAGVSSKTSLNRQGQARSGAFVFLSGDYSGTGRVRRDHVAERQPVILQVVRSVGTHGTQTNGLVSPATQLAEGLIEGNTPHPGVPVRQSPQGRPTRRMLSRSLAQASV